MLFKATHKLKALWRRLTFFVFYPRRAIVLFSPWVIKPACYLSSDWLVEESTASSMAIHPHQCPFFTLLLWSFSALEFLIHVWSRLRKLSSHWGDSNPKQNSILIKIRRALFIPKRKIMLVSYWLGWTHSKIVLVEICIDKKCSFNEYPSNCAPDYFMAKKYESLPIICPHQHWGQFYTLTLQLTRVNPFLKIKLNSVLFYTFLFHRCKEFLWPEKKTKQNKKLKWLYPQSREAWGQ